MMLACAPFASRPAALQKASPAFCRLRPAPAASVKFNQHRSAARAWTPCMCGPPGNIPEVPSTAADIPKHLQSIGPVLPELVDLTRMTAKQINTTLKLISWPEISTRQWWKQYNFIEDIHDHRGYTVTIFGACSGTGDLVMIFDELQSIRPRSADCTELLQYTERVRRKRGGDTTGIEGIVDIIGRLGDDPAWQQAVWKVYIKLYWNFAMKWANKQGNAASRPGPVLTTPASRGFMVDVCINHGANKHSLMPIVDLMDDHKRNTTDEVKWITAFAAARRKMLRSHENDLDTSHTGDRCTLWMKLFSDNPTLATPIDLSKPEWVNLDWRRNSKPYWREPGLAVTEKID